MSIKPKIIKEHGYWFCFGRGIIGAGFHPTIAYNNWRNHFYGTMAQ
jgi:hypothetical protein